MQIKIEIPIIIICLIILYISLSISNETFKVVAYSDDKTSRILSESKIIKNENEKENGKSSPAATPKSNKGLLVLKRDNTSKYIKESMLLNKPNHNLGFLPSNVRFMDLTYLKPTEIGRIPVLLTDK